MQDHHDAKKNGFKHPYISDIDTLPRDELERLQLGKLKEQVVDLAKNSPYYQKVFKENNISADIFKNLDDLKKAPFVDKDVVGNSQALYPPFGEFKESA